MSTCILLVQLHGNHRIILEYYPVRLSNSGRYEVRMHEDEWVNHVNRLHVSRSEFMVALQNVQMVLIRATDTVQATEATLDDVTLDLAKPRSAETTTWNPVPALGVELCDCPKEFSSTSCQDPGSGFYRWYKKHFITSEVVIDLVGESRKCQCNGRTERCHPETGRCLVRTTATVLPAKNVRGQFAGADPKKKNREKKKSFFRLNFEVLLI